MGLHWFGFWILDFGFWIVGVATGFVVQGELLTIILNVKMERDVRKYVKVDLTVY